MLTERDSYISKHVCTREKGLDHPTQTLAPLGIRERFKPPHQIDRASGSQHVWENKNSDVVSAGETVGLMSTPNLHTCPATLPISSSTSSNPVFSPPAVLLPIIPFPWFPTLFHSTLFPIALPVLSHQTFVCVIYFLFKKEFQCLLNFLLYSDYVSPKQIQK